MRTGAHQRSTAFKGLFFGGIGHERQIRHDQRALITPAHAFGVIDHVCQGHRHGAVMTLQYVAQGIAHQQHLDAGSTGQMGKGAVVGGEHGKFFALLFEFVQGAESDWHIAGSCWLGGVSTMIADQYAAGLKK